MPRIKTGSYAVEYNSIGFVPAFVTFETIAEILNTRERKPCCPPAVIANKRFRRVVVDISARYHCMICMEWCLVCGHGVGKTVQKFVRVYARIIKVEKAQLREVWASVLTALSSTSRATLYLDLRDVRVPRHINSACYDMQGCRSVRAGSTFAPRIIAKTK